MVVFTVGSKVWVSCGFRTRVRRALGAARVRGDHKPGWEIASGSQTVARQHLVVSPRRGGLVAPWLETLVPARRRLVPGLGPETLVLRVAYDVPRQDAGALGEGRERPPGIGDELRDGSPRRRPTRSRRSRGRRVPRFRRRSDATSSDRRAGERALRTAPNIRSPRATLWPLVSAGVEADSLGCGKRARRRTPPGIGRPPDPGNVGRKSCT